MGSARSGEEARGDGGADLAPSSVASGASAASAAAVAGVGMPHRTVTEITMDLLKTCLGHRGKALLLPKMFVITTILVSVVGASFPGKEGLSESVLRRCS